MQKNNCVCCDSKNLELILDLGYQPWCNNFLTKEEMDIVEKARHIMCHISGNTHQSDAVKYFNKIQQEENAKEITAEKV